MIFKLNTLARILKTNFKSILFLNHDANLLRHGG